MQSVGHEVEPLSLEMLQGYLPVAPFVTILPVTNYATLMLRNSRLFTNLTPVSKCGTKKKPKYEGVNFEEEFNNCGNRGGLGHWRRELDGIPQ